MTVWFGFIVKNFFSGEKVLFPCSVKFFSLRLCLISTNLESIRICS